MNDTTPPLLKVVDGRAVPVPGTYDIEPGFTMVRFQVRRLFTPTHGHFGVVRGRIVIVEAPTRSNIMIEVDTTSLWLGHAGTLKAARSAEFLAVDDHPIATFVSTALVPAEDETWHLHGDLAIRGVVRTVTFAVRLVGAAVHPLSGVPTLTLRATTAIDRRDFGIDAYQIPVPGAVGVLVVGNTICLEIDLEATGGQNR